MARRAVPRDIDLKSPPFDRFTSVQRLSAERSGHASVEHVRHHLLIGRDTRTRTGALIKLTSKPGRVYEQNLENEIASLTTINRELRESRYFPVVHEHGRLPDGRVYLITSLFDELPLAMSIGTGWMPDRLVAHLKIALAVSRALAQLHSIDIYHVDLNPMNILHRTEQDRPIIRIVDFESSYEVARHSTGAFYDPPTTPRFSAPEVSRQAPDARADVYSFGAVLYTMLVGYGWTWDAGLAASVEQDGEMDPELKVIVQSAVHDDPDRRCRSIETMREALAAYLERIWPGRSWQEPLDA
jgi:serine/threonine protein kinase